MRADCLSFARVLLSCGRGRITCRKVPASRLPRTYCSRVTSSFTLTPRSTHHLRGVPLLWWLLATMIRVKIWGYHKYWRFFWSTRPPWQHIFSHRFSFLNANFLYRQWKVLPSVSPTAWKFKEHLYILEENKIEKDGLPSPTLGIIVPKLIASKHPK